MRRKLRRFAAAALAGFYLAQASWVLTAGADLLLPKFGPLASVAPVPCGCSTEGACGGANRCCCAPEGGGASAEAEATPVSAVEAARCAGVEVTIAQLRTAALPVELPRPEVMTSSLLETPDPHPFLSVPVRSPDKVPRA